MTSQIKRSDSGQSQPTSTPLSWREQCAANLAGAVEKFNRENQGKTWVELADEIENSQKSRAETNIQPL